MSKKTKVPEFYSLHEDTITEIKTFITKELYDVNLKFLFVGSRKQKECVKIKKIPANYEFVYGDQVLITVNEELYELVAQDDSAIKVLLNDAFSGLSIDPESGEAKIKNEQFTSSPNVIERFGIQEVKTAKDLEQLTFKQLKDKEEQLTDDINIGE